MIASTTILRDRSSWLV